VTTQNDAATASARAQLYQQTAKIGRVLNRTFAFYNGAPMGNSFTGNQALGVTSGGVGAALINGIGPPLVAAVPCDTPTIFSVVILFLDDNVRLTITYSNPQPDDIFVLFNSAGQSFKGSPPSMTGPNEVEILFPDVDRLPAGVYSLKILRASSPTTCFSVRNNIFLVEGTVCTLAVDGWSGNGVSPFPPPPLIPGETDNVVSVTGSGFLSGPLTVTIFAILGGPDNLNIASVNVIDDNNLDVQFDADPVQTGVYAVRVELTDDAACFGEYGTEFGQDMLSVQEA
jgi:hypothetical protein